MFLLVVLCSLINKTKCSRSVHILDALLNKNNYLIKKNQTRVFLIKTGNKILNPIKIINGNFINFSNLGNIL